MKYIVLFFFVCAIYLGNEINVQSRSQLLLFLDKVCTMYWLSRISTLCTIDTGPVVFLHYVL